MKKAIILFSLAGLCTTSCLKTKTCTCKNSSGKVITESTKKTNNKTDLENFEADCKKMKTQETVNGQTVYTPCEIS